MLTLHAQRIPTFTVARGSVVLGAFAPTPKQEWAHAPEPGEGRRRKAGLMNHRQLTAILALSMLPLAVLPAAASADPGIPDLGSVVLSLDEVNALVEGDGFLHDNPARQTPQDYGSPPGLPDPCRNSTEQTQVFGGDYTAFRAVSYSGASNVGVQQVVAVYPSVDIARQVYRTYVRNLQDCQSVYPTALFGEPVPAITLIPGTPNTAVLEQVGPGIGRGWARLFEIDGNAIISVTAGNFPPDTPVVRQVADRIQQNLGGLR